MKKVSIDDVPVQPNPMKVHSVRKPVGQRLGTTDFAMNYFELQPGESFSGGMHTHHDQEEVFHVVSGTVTFDTRDPPGEPDADDSKDADGPTVREVPVDAGEAIRFAPGEFQQGTNKSDDVVVGWAFGAPGAMHDWDQLESIVHCRECGEETGHGLELTDDIAFRLTCTECDHAFTIG